MPIGRLAKPEEIASVAQFLCSPGASYMSGAVVDVNGGIYVS
jgi:NAD(P)-dependent dehydrogenase (short-subunit alcohol dehydrogenase family)